MGNISVLLGATGRRSSWVTDQISHRSDLLPSSSLPAISNASLEAQASRRRSHALESPSTNTQDVPVERQQLESAVEQLFSGEFIARVVAGATARRKPSSKSVAGHLPHQTLVVSRRARRGRGSPEPRKNASGIIVGGSS
jgi:hypothetical protein